jgi:hypothetical protein
MTTATAKSITVTIDATAARYQDADDCFALAVREYTRTRPALAGWDLSPRWADDQREEILLTVPAWAV